MSHSATPHHLADPAGLVAWLHPGKPRKVPPTQRAVLYAIAMLLTLVLIGLVGLLLSLLENYPSTDVRAQTRPAQLPHPGSGHTNHRAASPDQTVIRLQPRADQQANWRTEPALRPPTTTITWEFPD